MVSGEIGSMKLLLVKTKPALKVIKLGAIKNLTITNGNASQVLTYQCLLVYNETMVNKPISMSPIAELTIVKPSK